MRPAGQARRPSILAISKGGATARRDAAPAECRANSEPDHSIIQRVEPPVVPPTSTVKELDHMRPSAQQLSGRIIDAAVPTDSRQQAAIDRILSSMREAVEPTVRSYADEIVQTATAELRREADLATA